MVDLLWFFEEQPITEFRLRVNDLRLCAENGCAKSAFMLSQLYDPWCTIPPETKIALGVSQETSIYFAKLAFDLFSLQYEAGDGEAAHYLSLFYQEGYPFAPQNSERFVELNEFSVSHGYIFAANELLTVYSTKTSRFYNPARARQMHDLLEQHMIRFVEYCPGFLESREGREETGAGRVCGKRSE